MVAYGASKKIFEDRMDTDSIQQILPEYNKRFVLANRRTVVQQTNQRTSTIYTENLAGFSGTGWGQGSQF